MNYKRLKYTLVALLNTCSWFRNHKTSKNLTEFIHRSLDTGHKLNVIDNYYVTLNGVKLWVENYPYSFGNVVKSDGYHSHSGPQDEKRLPSRGAARRLRLAVIAALGRDLEKEMKDYLNSTSEQYVLPE